MPSRKRNKGKERKAKKEEQKSKERVWQSWAFGECKHGKNVLTTEGHPVTKYIDLFCSGESLYDRRTDMLQYPEVYNNASYRKMASDILVSMGTNFLRTDCNVNACKELARAILVLENYNEADSIDSASMNRVVATKIRELWCETITSKRDILKFFSKRIACSCLKDMYSHARQNIPKLGECFWCDEIEERSSLMVCGRCRISHYCSRECQINGWRKHKPICDHYTRAHKKHKRAAESCAYLTMLI